jgi:primosomal protein N' (replication factor Y)
MASVQGVPAAVADFVAAIELPPGCELLGPVPAADGEERLLLRTSRSDGLTLAAALKAGQAVRSARKGDPVRVELDPQTLT